MSYQEKKAIVELCSAILIFGLYSLYVFLNYHDQITADPNNYKFWGKAFLILIPVSIIAHIIIYIVFAIIIKITTGEDMPNFMDELDKLIELKATRNSYWTFILGFFLAMTSQVMGMEPWVMFLVLIFSGFIASIVTECTKLYLYRRGV